LATGGHELSDVDVAIVGGGFSGIAVAAELARSATPPSVALFERRDRIGPGVAYSTPFAGHLTNSRAAKMSAYLDDPDHFVRWLDGRGGPHDFVSRRLYGDYLVSVAAALARPGFAAIRATVAEIAAGPDGTFRVVAGDGAAYRARAVVLATGNLESETAGIPPALLAHPRYVRNPYVAEYAGIDGDVLIVGSGSSALDAIVALDAAGFAGTIHTLSRRGLFPLPHAEVAGYDGVPAFDGPHTALGLVRRVRRAVADARAAGYDWRAVVDALRGRVPALWSGLDPRERARFVRHVQRYWNVHRHRAPESIEAVRARLAAEGRLVVHRGRIAAVGDETDALAVEIGGHSPVRLVVARAINAHGPTADYTRCTDPLIAGMLAAGLLAPAPLALGLMERCPGLFLAGPAERWERYESTAVPELREGARLVAARVAAKLASS